MNRDQARLACSAGVFVKVRCPVRGVSPAAKVLSVNGRTARVCKSGENWEADLERIEVDVTRNAASGILVPPALLPGPGSREDFVILNSVDICGWVGPSETSQSGWSQSEERRFLFSSRADAERQKYVLRGNGVSGLEVMTFEAARERLERYAEEMTDPGRERAQLTRVAAEFADDFDLPTAVLAEMLTIKRERDRIRQAIDSDRELRARRESDCAQAQADMAKIAARLQRYEGELDALQARWNGVKGSLFQREGKKGQVGAAVPM